MPDPKFPRIAPRADALAESLASAFRAAGFRNGGRPGLMLSFPESLGESQINALLLVEPDGSLGTRSFVTFGAPDAARLRRHAAEPGRKAGHGFAPFVNGLHGGWSPDALLARAAVRIVRESAPDLAAAAADALARDASRRAAAMVSPLIDAAVADAGFASGHLAGLASLRRFQAPDRSLTDLLLGPPGPVPDAIAETCASSPLMAELATRHKDVAEVRDLLAGGVVGLSAALCGGPGGAAEDAVKLRGRLARLGGIGLADIPGGMPPFNASAVKFARLLCDAPVDWIRPDPDCVQAMMAVSSIHEPLARMEGADPAALLAPARGDWAGFLSRCRAACTEKDAGYHGGIDPAAVAADNARDMTMHFLNKVVLPTMALVERPADGMPEDWLARGIRASRALLFGDKGAPAVLEAVTLWHVRIEAIEARIPEGNRSSWDPPCDDFVASNGVEVRPLSSARALVEEGAAGTDPEGIPGLSHCVAGYRSIAQAGLSHILSVRAPGGAPRLSTVEVKVDAYGRARVMQHKGFRNGKAPAEAVRAVGEFVTSVRLPVPVEPEGKAPAGRIQQQCGYDWRNPDLVRLAAQAYAPFLPRPLRDGDIDRIAEWAGFEATPGSAPRP